MKASPTAYLRDENGMGAAEFVLILPPLAMFIFGFMHLCMMLYTSTQLHWATEDAARCASVRAECKSSGVPTQALVSTWADARYRGLAQADFALSSASCGHKVIGTATYNFNVPFISSTFDLQSDACFP